MQGSLYISFGDGHAHPLHVFVVDRHACPEYLFMYLFVVDRHASPPAWQMRQSGIAAGRKPHPTPLLSKEREPDALVRSRGVESVYAFGWVWDGHAHPLQNHLGDRHACPRCERHASPGRLCVGRVK